MKKSLKIIKTVLLTLLCLIIITAGFLFISPMLIGRDDSTVKGSDSWMSGIDGSLLICDIAVPGTHDSGSDRVQLAYFAKCQSSSVKQQLLDGYRYLDIRLGVKNVKGEDKLIFYHGFCKCKTGWLPWATDLDLSYVLSDCYAFLSDHPTETVIFAVKMEQGSDVAAFQNALNTYIQKAPEKWYLSSELPTLDQCRGKIVLMRRYEDLAELGRDSGIQMDWTDQGGNDDVSLNAEIVQQPAFYLQVQDRYKYAVKDKWTAFTAGLSKTSEEKPLVRLHFLSTNGTPKFGHPYSYAKILNKNLISEDLSAFGKAWIITDFSTAAMAEKIYSLNK